MDTAELLTRLNRVTKTPTGWMACCPAHDDHNPSLSVSEGTNGTILLRCFAGCTLKQICDRLGVQISDLFQKKAEQIIKRQPKVIVAEYSYTDADGGLLFQVLRYEPKDFRQRRPDGQGHWIWGLKAGEYVQGYNGDWYWANPEKNKPGQLNKSFPAQKPVLFRLPETVADVKRGLPIFLCEGEKDVLAMVDKGFSATCNPLGANKWQDSYSETMRGADIAVIADKDNDGRKHAQFVAGKLHGIAKSVRVLELPDVADKPVKDAADFFKAGGDVGQIVELADKAPLWTPPVHAAETETEKNRESLARMTASLFSDAAKSIMAKPNQAEDICQQVRSELDRLDAPGDEVSAQPIGSLVAPAPGDENELLKHRFLCRGGSMLVVGQSGQGKSSLTMQMAVNWCLGRDCFGVNPTRPLRVLIIQAENDPGDMREMFDGIVRGLELSPEDKKIAEERILVYWEDSLSGDAFLKLVKRLVKKHCPDLVIIDPALAYIGGDTKDAECVGSFLRRGLNPILHEHNCAALIVHHTTKAKADGPQSTHDFLYAGAGSIEFTNWARAVLALETRGNGCYRLHAPKRGTRIGWKDANGETAFSVFIQHTRSKDMICWLPMDQTEIQTAAKNGKSKYDLLDHVPQDGNILQSVLLDKANDAGIGQKKCRAFLDELIRDGILHVRLEPRPGTNPAKSISRQPKT